MPDKDIRILHIITKLAMGGAQMNTLISARDISRMGYTSHVLTGSERPEEGDLFGLAESWGLKVIRIPHLRRDISLYHDILAFFEIVDVIKKGEYDIVHTHGSKARFLGRIAAARFPGVKIIQTAHGWPFFDAMPSYLKHFYVLLEKIGFNLAHYNLCVSYNDIEKALRFGIGHRNDHLLIRSGVEFEEFRKVRGRKEEARKLLDLERNGPIVGTTMRFCSEKAPDVFVDVAEAILKTRPDTSFVMVGDGPLFDKTMKLIDSRNLSDSFVLTGCRNDVNRLLPAFDVFLITSRTEGLPRAMLEALAAGIPVVSTDVGGIHELVNGKKNGILCRENDVDALVKGVLSLLDDPSKGAELLRNVDEDIKPFSASAMVRELYRLYTRITNPDMKVVFLCDDEPFLIPETIARIIRRRSFNDYTLVSLRGHGSMKNALKNVRRYAGLYGFPGFFVQLAKYAVFKISGLLRLPTKTSHSLKQTARRTRARYLSIDNINSKSSRKLLASLQPDVFISIACPQILRKKTLEIPSKGAWNVHSALLPKNRGMLPTFWALYRGDTPGVTMHKMTPQLDAGGILVRKKIDVTIEDVSLQQLLALSKKTAADVVVEGLDKISDGGYDLLPNPAHLATKNTFPSRVDVAGFREKGGSILGKKSPRPAIAISFDVEEWFQTYAARKWYPCETWNNIPGRVSDIVKTITDILERHNAKATFFFLGWIAERHPDLLEMVAEKGHEVGYHGYDHLELTLLKKKEFENNLNRFLSIVDGLSVPRPVGFRAPSFSMKKDTVWAVETLKSKGFRYDSSIYPMFKTRYGIPEAPQDPFILNAGETEILELPLASIIIAGLKVPIAGGAYLRFYPGYIHRIMLRLFSRTGKIPVLYFHPWEIDSVNISGDMSMFQKIRQHHNSGKNTISKIEKILKLYRGVTLREVAEAVDPLSLEKFSL